MTVVQLERLVNTGRLLAVNSVSGVLGINRETCFRACQILASEQQRAVRTATVAAFPNFGVAQFPWNSPSRGRIIGRESLKMLPTLRSETPLWPFAAAGGDICR
jgi:hypothetical protein